MKVLILAAGYGTRLYPITLDNPKPLLLVADKPIINYILDKLEEIPNIKDIYVITNNFYYDKFAIWRNSLDKKLNIEILNDETNTESDKLGAIKDIYFAVNKKNINEELLVIGGDNFFEFNLDLFVKSFYNYNTCLVGIYNLFYKNLAKEYGTVELGSDKKIKNFLEKSDYPISSLVSTCIYMFSKEYLKYLEKYILEDNNVDAPGNFIKWLSLNYTAYGYIFEKDWYDIGSKQSYDEVNEKFKQVINYERSF